MKKVILCLIFILLTASSAFASTTDIDALIDIIYQGDFDTEVLLDFQGQMNNSEEDRAIELFLIARSEIDAYKYRSAYKYLKESLQLAKLTSQHRLEAEILYYLTKLEYYFGKITSALTYSNQLREIASSEAYTHLLIEADLNIAYGFMYYYDYDEALEFLTEALDLSNEIDYNSGITKYYSMLGLLYYYDIQDDASIDNYKLAIDQYSPDDFYVLGNQKLNLVLDLANQYKHMASYDLMYEQLITAEGLLDNTGPLEQSYYYELLGDYYLKRPEKDLNIAAEAYETSIQLIDRTYKIPNSYPFEAHILKALGALHFEMGNFKSSAEFYNRALNVDYGETSEDVEQVLGDLEDIKLESINKEMELLEKLNKSNAEKYQMTRRFLLFLTVGIAILLLAIILAIKEMRSKSKTEKQLYYNSITDSLTKIYNRGKIIDIFSSKLREDNAVILLDIDDFKDINDTYGHLAGDMVLIELAEVISNSIRESDQLGRYGGEEFLIVIENTSIEELQEIGERIRANIESHIWPYKDLVTTASIGITKCFSEDAETVLHEVDTLMYNAKRNGKNQIAFNI